jgi:hypothetical protein
VIICRSGRHAALYARHRVSLAANGAGSNGARRGICDLPCWVKCGITGEGIIAPESIYLGNVARSSLEADADVRQAGIGGVSRDPSRLRADPWLQIAAGCVQTRDFPRVRKLFSTSLKRPGMLLCRRLHTNYAAAPEPLLPLSSHIKYFQPEIQDTCPLSITRRGFYLSVEHRLSAPPRTCTDRA